VQLSNKIDSDTTCNDALVTNGMLGNCGSAGSAVKENVQDFTGKCCEKNNWQCLCDSNNLTGTKFNRRALTGSGNNKKLCEDALDYSGAYCSQLGPDATDAEMIKIRDGALKCCEKEKSAGTRTLINYVLMVLGVGIFLM